MHKLLPKGLNVTLLCGKILHPMNSCEGIAETRARISERAAAISNGLMTNFEYNDLPFRLYLYLFDAETEQNFIHILSREKDIYGRLKITAQSDPYMGGSESTILDAVLRIREIFKRRDTILLCDAISEAKLIGNCTPQEIGRGRFRIFRPEVGVVDYYTERSVLNIGQVKLQTHSHSPVDVLR